MIRKEDRIGLEITIIVHLVVVIVLLILGIGRELSRENSFILDFTQQEEREQQVKQENFEQEVSRRIDEMIARSSGSVQIRNVAVSSNLKDDRHSAAEAKALMDDADRLARELGAGFKPAIEEDARETAVEYKPEAASEARPYSGPSVLDWTLEGRKASHLPIPAYRCYGAGTVTVIISVDQQGNVTGAKINNETSSEDNCLRDFALRAAKMSKFNRDTSAPVRQAGQIVYSFIAQ